MKKALILTLLLSGLLFYGCGSKGGTAASSNGGNSTSTPEIGTPSGPVAGFTLNLVDASESLNKIARYTLPGTIQTPTDVRVVIRSFATVTTTRLVCPGNDFDADGNCNVAYQPIDVGTFTEVFRDIQDVVYSGPTVTVGIAAGTGYTLDVITSLATTTNHSIVKYGQVTGLTVAPGGSATVTMKTVNDILNMTVANDVISNRIFNVTTNNVMPFASQYSMVMSFGTTTPQQVSTTNNTVTFTAPVSYATGSVTLQGTFTLNSSCLKKLEPGNQWTRLFPDATYSEQVYSNLDPLIVVTVPAN